MDRLAGRDGPGARHGDRPPAGGTEGPAASEQGQAVLEDQQQDLRNRHRAGAALVEDPGERTPQEPSREFGPADEDGLATVAAANLDGAIVRGGIREHGYALVRDLVDPAEATRLAGRIGEAFAARRRGTGEQCLYEEFVPEPPHPKVADRPWIAIGGGLLAVDSPALFSEVFRLFERIGLRQVIAEFLDEPVTVAAEKCTLRRARPGPPGGWHQDGSFMGRTRALNVWVSLSDCGVDAPGLDFVPRRVDELLETGSEGSGAEHLDRPEEGRVSPKTLLIAPQLAEHAAGDLGVMRPRFRPGDVMLFDDRFLHRTGSEEHMTRPRFAIESWFFGASGFPTAYTPLAF